MRLYKLLFSFGLLALTTLLTPGLCSASSIAYTVSVNTSFVSGTTGYIDMEFNPGVPASQPATANVVDLYTNGTLNGFTDPTNTLTGITGDVTGMLPQMVTFDNGQTTNDYAEQIKFGSYIQFYLFLSGSAIDNPNGAGGGSFFLDFYDGNFNQLLTDSFGVLQVNINGDGTATAITFPYAGNGGNPVVSLSGVPEPSTLLLFAGALPLLAFCVYRKVRQPSGAWSTEARNRQAAA
jgi:hypothetical protein